MTDYNLPSGIRAELRIANKWYGMGCGLLVLGLFLFRVAILAGLVLIIYGFILDTRAKKKAKRWRKENGYA